ncbi:hypothetical protein BSR28_05035 [Boudabousia liubingyangii]|uniref:DUF4429 domain-containing protein n=1 Tax=Boudabousia liubingyangii TaxID=1921764 RepID=UPI00093C4CA9|nr:DUF4429 domain-containing protein [Boudabousia liubingyangii]OKL46805.1 hypothetical protein BSR28_05035 [Boudabousia liubingyangii]
MFFKGVNGQIDFDGQKVTITREGFMARASQGRSSKVLHLHQIAAVQYKPPSRLVNGFIQFSVSGELSEKVALKGQRTKAAAQDENAVILWHKHKEEAEALVDAINDALAAQHQPTGEGSSAGTDIEKLAELHSQGILTDEEFAAAKAKALGL